METSAILLRFALYLDLMALFGIAAFGLHALRGPERRSGAVLPLRPLLAGSAALGLVLSGLGLLVLAASMGGVAPTSVDRATVDLILWDTTIGTAWLVRMATLILALAFVALGRRRPALALFGIAAMGAIPLGSLAWTGHGAASEGTAGWLHLIADVVHLLAAGVWVGALLALTALVLRRPGRVDEQHLRLTHRALHGFSVTGTLVVGLLVVTGLVSTWMLVGPDRLVSLGTTFYGRLLLAKLALFAAMLALAAANRFRLTPALEGAIASGDQAGALGALRRSLVVETTCAVVVLALVAWLGTLEPPAALM